MRKREMSEESLRAYGKQEKRRMPLIALAFVLLVVVLVGSVTLTIVRVNDNMEEFCFDELQSATVSLANQFRETMENDRTILRAVATILATKENATDEELCRVMSAFEMSSSFVTYVELLLPENRLLLQDGTTVDTAGQLDFKEEAERGEYISERTRSISHPPDLVLRNAVPVLRDGETVAMLYGTVSLSALSKIYKTDIYDGNAYVYLLDSETGDFLMDTWHKTLGNFFDFTQRTMRHGYSFDTAIEDMRNDRGGNLCFISKTIGDALYMHYEPLGINNWNVIVTVAEKTAFSKARTISGALYTMALVAGGALLLFMGCFVLNLMRSLRTIKRLGSEDQTTGLKNRNAFELRTAMAAGTFWPSIGCVYLDVNGLHEMNNVYGHARGDQMLWDVARALEAAFPKEEVYRVGGDEFVALCPNLTEAACDANIAALTEQLDKAGYSVSVGKSFRTDEHGFERVVKEADDNMLANKRAYYAAHERREPR